MNKDAQDYWDEYWQGQEQPQSVTAWQFGVDPDHLAQLAAEGIKTATCSGRIFYEVEDEPLPAEGEYSVILDGDDKPTSIIKTVEVTITPMNEVSEAFAISEGEGDRTYQYWWNAHVEVFSKELKNIGQKFSEDMLLVCERFEVIHVKEN